MVYKIITITILIKTIINTKKVYTSNVFETFFFVDFLVAFSFDFLNYFLINDFTKTSSNVRVIGITDSLCASGNVFSDVSF